MAKTKTGSTVKQVEKFGLVGIINTLLDYVIFIGLTVIFSIPRTDVYKAKFVSGAIAMINSFYLNRRWVFKNRQAVAGAAIRFFVSTIVGVFFIQLGLTQILTSNFPYLGELAYSVANWLGITALADSIHPRVLTEDLMVKTVAFGIATLASMTWNFLLYKFWAFKE